MGSLFESLGLKRYVASLLSVIVEVLRMIPGAAQYLSVIDLIAGFFGITGITHAGATGNLTKKKLSTASAAVASLLAICYFVPVLFPLIPFLEKLAGILGALAVGAQLKAREVKKAEAKTFGITPKHDSL